MPQRPKPGPGASKPPSVKEAATDYRRGLSFVDEAFARGKAALGDSVPCKKGCSACCAAVFDVHPADAILLGVWLEEQSASEQERILVRAEEVLTAVETAAECLSAEQDVFDGWTPADGFRMLPAAGLTRLAGEVTLPCPLLGSAGECLAHESRPSLCRLQGLSFQQPGSDVTLQDFCRLEPAQADNPPQALDLQRLDEERHEATEKGKLLGLGKRLPEGRTFVAEALIRWAEKV